MKLNIAILSVCLFLVSSAFTSPQPTKTVDNTIPTYTEQEVRSRLKAMDLCVPARYNSVVKSYIRTYMVTKRSKASDIIGRTVQYFPIYEKYIKEKGLPDDLKYVSVLESALNPVATSRSNAVGLWQFMAPTARDYDLVINRTVDERRDPHRATKAALTYLEKLHARYGNWALALAAYNGGPGRVNRAIKRGRSKNFWQISKYLPRETRNYVPAFFAAAYLINYYEEHNITPNYPELDLQIVDVAKVYQTITFDEISKLTGIPTYTIETLNPSYQKWIIPGHPLGNYLILPQRVMGAFLQYQKRPDSRQDILYSSTPIPAPATNSNSNFFKTKYIVQSGDNIHSIARLFKCNTHNIKAWNRLYSDYVKEGQELTLFQPIVSIPYEAEAVVKVTKPVVRELKKYNVVNIPTPSLTTLKVNHHKGTRTLASLTNESYVYYRVGRGESLSSIANKFPGVTLDDILEINDISPRRKGPKPGSRIKIKKK